VNELLWTRLNTPFLDLLPADGCHNVHDLTGTEIEAGVMALTVERKSVGAIRDDLSDLVDLGRYPIDAPASPAYRQMVAAAKEGLNALGACLFEGFLRPKTVARILAQVDPMEDEAYVCGQPHNVYLVAADPSYPPAHACNRLVRSQKAVLADDELPAASPLRTLYEAQGFRTFVRDALEVEQLFPFEDPLASINVNFYGADQELGWHFDNSKFTVTLMLRQAAAGGIFAFAPNIREENAAGYAAVARILDGDHAAVRELKQDPGALVLFKGSRSLHRVTPCVGEISRVIAILSYLPEPGQGLKEHTRKIFYGRTH
jgi:hypothetical protein